MTTALARWIELFAKCLKIPLPDPTRQAGYTYPDYLILEG